MLGYEEASRYQIYSPFDVPSKYFMVKFLWEQLVEQPNGNVVYPERSEEHTSELQSRFDLVCRLLLEKKNSGTLWMSSRKSRESTAPRKPRPERQSQLQAN